MFSYDKRKGTVSMTGKSDWHSFGLDKNITRIYGINFNDKRRK